MPKSRVTRRALLAGAAPLVAAGPLAKLAFADGRLGTTSTSPRTWATSTRRSATRP